MSGFKWTLLMVLTPKSRMFLPKLVFSMVQSQYECGLGHSVKPWKARRLWLCGKVMFVTPHGKGTSKGLCRLYQSYWPFWFYSWKVLLTVLCSVWLTVQVAIEVLEKPWFHLLASFRQRCAQYSVLEHHLTLRLNTETTLDFQDAVDSALFVFQMVLFAITHRWSALQSRSTHLLGRWVWHGRAAWADSSLFL